MFKRTIHTLIIFVVCISWFISYTSFASNKIELVFQLSGRVYLDTDIELRENLFLYKSDFDIQDYILRSSCNMISKMISNTWDYYLFKVRYGNDSCDDTSIELINTEWEIIRSEKNYISFNTGIYDTFLDYSSSDLKNFYSSLEKQLQDTSNELIKDGQAKMKNERKLQEARYLLSVLDHTLKMREEKYVVPVVWWVISDNPSRIPNAWRPYREAITDGIHHGWDVYWPLWEETISIDDGIVVRVVRDFEYSDLSGLNWSDNLSNLDKAKNLDTYRWNQVWVKTMKWDIVFYSHLTSVSEYLQEWKMIRKGEYIGTTGITGVPDKNYTDYHLHFTIHKNPYISRKAWKYTIDDYLLWDWYFKWDSMAYILENQNRIFEQFSVKK